jgi:hypothetical protein
VELVPLTVMQKFGGFGCVAMFEGIIRCLESGLVGRFDTYSM